MKRNQTSDTALKPCRAAPAGRRGVAAIQHWTRIAVGAQLLVALSAAATEQPAASAGKLAFNNHCRTCHSLKQGDHRQGPSLHGIFGAKAGASDYGGYSQGIKSSGLTWDETTLDRFIEKPDQVAPSNNMKPYAGMTDAETRKKIVEFLRSESKGS